MNKIIELKKYDLMCVIKWIFTDIILKRKGDFILISVLGLLAASAQAGVFFVINAYVNHNRLTFKIDFILKSIGLMLDVNSILILVVFFGFLISASLTFLNAKLTLSLWRKSQLGCINEILNAIQRAINCKILDKNLYGSKFFLKPLKSTVRIGAFVRILAISTSPLMRFIILSIYAAHVYLDLTLIILSVSLMAGIISTLFFSRLASAKTRHSELSNVKSTDHFIYIIDSLFDSRQDKNNFKSGDDNIFLHQSNALIDSIFASDKSRFISMTSVAITLGFYMYFSGYTNVMEQNSSASNLLYLLSIIFALLQLVLLSQIVTNFGRFYPILLNHVQLLKSLNEAESSESLECNFKSAGIISTVDVDMNDY
jgi:hypothetical protein